MTCTKLMSPRRGDRVELRYGKRTREWIGLHEATGTILATPRGPGPKNSCVLIDGELLPRSIPWGHLWKEQP